VYVIEKNDLLVIEMSNGPVIAANDVPISYVQTYTKNIIAVVLGRG